LPPGGAPLEERPLHQGHHADGHRREQCDGHQALTAVAVTLGTPSLSIAPARTPERRPAFSPPNAHGQRPAFLMSMARPIPPTTNPTSMISCLTTWRSALG